MISGRSVFRDNHDRGSSTCRNRTTPRFKEVEKQRIVEIIAVDVVEVYYIRIVVADI